MKRIILLFLVVFLFALAGESQVFTPPNKELTENDLKDKTVSELWLMRNSIFAKHGRGFKTYELHAFFSGQPWYKIRKNYKFSDLSQTDLDNIKLLVSKENELRKNDFITENGSKMLNFNNIYNVFQYPQFTETEKEMLSKNGFFATPSNKEQLYEVYEENDYYGVPSFITTDVVLQLYHQYFDMTLRSIEENYLSEKLSILLKQLSSAINNALSTETDPAVMEALNFNLAYLAVAQYFISDGKIQPKGMKKAIAMAEINLCKNHSGWENSPLFMRKFDYSQFVPRGHYTSSQKLKNYFMAMMWLGFAGIELEKTQNILNSVILTHFLYSQKYKNKPLVDYWRDIYDITVFYVGLSDDTGPLQIHEGMQKIFPEADNLDAYDNQQKLLQLAALMPEERISGSGKWGKQKKQFRLMGQRFVPDSYIFDRLTNKSRKMPMSLDVMAALGNPLAKKLMLNDYKDTWQKMTDYPQILTSLIEENNKRSKQDWTQNLYYSWLYNITALWQIKDKTKLPFFMQNDAWDRKTLNTALASWAELRHNTILFAKQSDMAECGGGEEEYDMWLPDPPKGYVEPNVEFYSRMIDLMHLTLDGLTKKNMISYEVKDVGNKFIDALEFLKNASKKEVTGEKLTLEEYDQIQKFGSLLDNMTWDILYSLIGSDNITDEDKKMPVIADVHTADYSALEVGVGLPQEIYAVINIEGKFKICRGAIFSFYEFHQPISDRLTDKQWRAMLEKGQAPSQPEWINYKSLNFKKLRTLYEPKYPDIQKYSTKPGFQTIYYDTGC